MKYTYYTYEVGTYKRIDISTRFEDVENNYCQPSEYYVVIFEEGKANPAGQLNTLEDWQEWRTKLERDAAWKPFITNAKKTDKTETDSKIAQEVIDELPKEGVTYFVDDDGFHQKEVGSVTVTRPPDDLSIKEIFELLRKNRKDDAINPPHYKSFLDQYQWLEAMCRIQRYRDNPEQFQAALELQIRKYLDRCGRKDDRLQELEKAHWYLKFLIAYVKNDCKPIYVKDIDTILGA